VRGAKRLALVLPDMRGGGAERVALELARQWLHAGHRVDLVLLQSEGELLPLLPREVNVIDLAAPRIRSALRPLIAYLRRSRPDAVQVSMWPLTVVAIIAHQLAGSDARLVVSDHSTLSRQYAGFGWLGRQFLRTSIALFYPLAEARVAVSSGAADDLAQLSGLDRSSIQMIYSPIQRFRSSGACIEVDSLWGDAKVRILTVGSLKPEKNQRLLIEAMARLPGGLGAKLMLLGEGPLRGELGAAAEQLGLGADVIFQPFAADPGPYYRSADLFVLSSDYEGFGLVLVEALCNGLPVVSTDCESGPREILGYGEFGTLVPCGDADALAGAIAAALSAPPDRDRLVERGQVFSGQDSAERYLELMIPELDHYPR